MNIGAAAAPAWPCRIIVRTTAEEILELGPLVPAWWAPITLQGSTQRFEGKVLLDTGASGIMIAEEIALSLKLAACGTAEIHGAHGAGSLHNYSAKLVLPVIDSAGNALAIGIPTTCGAMPQLLQESTARGAPIVGILGRSFLQFCALQIEGQSGRVVVQIDKAVLLPR